MKIRVCYTFECTEEEARAFCAKQFGEGKAKKRVLAEDIRLFLRHEAEGAFETVISYAMEEENLF